MFHELIKIKMNEWYQSTECKIKSVIDYIVKKDKMRDAQIEAIKLYLFFKIYCKNLPLAKLFEQGYFLRNIDIDSMPLSKQFRDFLYANNSARQLYEIAISEDKYKALRKEIESKYDALDYKNIFADFFHGVNYADYIYSLPMGAGKTFLMAAFMYLDLYFALNEPYNKAFAHNFIVLAPSGLKSSIIPSLKNIKNFDVSWILPEPTATNLKNMIKYEILDEVKTSNKSNKIKNPNVQKIAQYQPYKDMFGVVFLTNAEKVILDKIDFKPNQISFDFNSKEEDKLEFKIANELRETIGKIPNKAIFIDEVHHVASEDIKLRQVVTNWTKNGNICEVIGFSGTPYLDTKEKFQITDSLTIENEDISNTIYYYPLVKGIDNFLKKPKIIASTDNNSLNIIKEGLDEFFDKYLNVTYNGLTSKMAIYSGKIETLEEQVYPFVAEYVASRGMNPNEVILKYYSGNDKRYVLPSENELEFASLNTKLSKKRIILLVGIGKEGWDCSSLTGVILSQKGCCPKKMILQTTCRCLRQVTKGEKETALIYLNSDNEKELSNQLKKNQHITIKELEKGTNIFSNIIERHNRMDKLNIPNIDYYKFNLKYEEEIKQEAKTSKDLKKLLSNNKIKENILLKELDLNGTIIDKNINEIIYGEKTTFNKWLLNISKESFGFVSLNNLKIYEKELKNIYDKITINNSLNMTYNHQLINSLIRTSFYDKRKLTTIREEIPESASILSIRDIPSIECDDFELQYPDNIIVKEILDKDNNINNKIDLESLSKEELIKLAKENPEVLTNLSKDESTESKLSDRTFHYIPYVFNQSEFEKTFLKDVLSLNKFKNSNLEIYYNGDHNISSFRIECFKSEDKKIKKVGLYTPDFLVISRKDNKVNKVLIIETKGSGYKNQQEFIDRKNYVEKDFIPFNNKKIGYKKFDYLYIEDSLSDKEIISLVNDKILEFFKEEK